MPYLLCPGSKLGDPYIRFDRLDEGFILLHSNSWFDLILMLFWILLCLIDEIMSKISQNDLHILHNGHTCQTCKIIEISIELVILAFTLLALGHANFECQHMPPCYLVKLAYQETFPMPGIAQGRWRKNTSAIYFFSILLIHANIAEIRKLVNTEIYGLRSSNYFGFQIA